jgi:hypothetical protein
MKKILTIIAFLAISMSFLSGCSETVGTKITFQNFASNKVFINFRASLITVDAGKTVDITDTPKGNYAYATTYQVPPGTTSSSAEGDVSGVIELTAGTRVLIVYGSTFVDGVYIINATKTTSDDLSGGGDIDPVGP